MQALTPFLAEACVPLAGQFFDAARFSESVADAFGLGIPRLAALGLADQLAREGLLEVVSKGNHGTVFRYAPTPKAVDSTSPVTEAEVESVIASFIKYARDDDRLRATDDSTLSAEFLDRLLNADSMHILGRREASIAIKATPKTITRKAPSPAATDSIALHLDFVVSQFLLDLKERDIGAFERVSAVAFANMAAEAIACFREPPSPGPSLDSLTVFLDSPLLLDMLGVNEDYAAYGEELLDLIRKSGAKAAVFDHCVTEAESAIYAQLSFLRSGVNQLSVSCGTSAKPDLLAALVGKVGERAQSRLGIEVQRDPEIGLHLRSAVAVGNIEAEMNRRMQGWGKEEAKEHDRRSVWSLLALRRDSEPCDRICDSTWLLLTRNTPLVNIANHAWQTWLHETTRHSTAVIDRWAPVAMSDKQFAGYVWSRSGGGAAGISTARLLAHCSAAVRPRADVKARAYNLVLELHGKAAAEDIAALLEDREGARAIMRTTHGDPEDVTPERLPLIVEKVKLAAGEFAAAEVRAQGVRELEAATAAYAQELTEVRIAAERQAQEAEARRVQDQLDRDQLEARNNVLEDEIRARCAEDLARRRKILLGALDNGVRRYRRLRWLVAIVFGGASGAVAWLAIGHPAVAAGITATLSLGGFWFVPDFLDRPISRQVMRQLLVEVRSKDETIEVPEITPDFKTGQWPNVTSVPDD